MTALKTHVGRRFRRALFVLSRKEGKRVSAAEARRRLGWKYDSDLYSVLREDISRGGSPTGKRREMVDQFIEKAMVREPVAP